MTDTNVPGGLSRAEAFACSKAPNAYEAGLLLAPRLIQDAFRSLFEDKHLYQSVQIPTEGSISQAADNYARAHLPQLGGSGMLPRHVDTSAPTVENHTNAARAQILRAFGSRWLRAGPGVPLANPVTFELPQPAIIYCPACDTRTAFHPVPSGDLAFAWVGTSKSTDEYHYTFGYECQQCRGPVRERVVFTVVRRGLKLTLCGRFPLETVRVESYIPKESAKFFSGAVIAKNAGQPLAGLFMLRTFIEQFWRTIEPVESARQAALNKGKRLTGDELAALYGGILPDAMKERFPSLGKVYSDLSSAIHAAKEEDDAIIVFEEAEAEIKEHFDARRVFKL